jgi:CelD/BcsL family acetyltransferase involved in cellulose biosynthesis
VDILSFELARRSSYQPPVIDKPASTSGGQSVRAVVFEDLTALAPHLLAWDALAVDQGKPFCAPGWMLSWWLEARTGDARLRVVMIFGGADLLAVGPFFAQVAFGLVELRLLAAGFSHRIGVLARDEDRAVAAPALAVALARVSPRVASVVFEGIDGADPWPELIAAHWPSSKAPRQRTDATMDAPVIDLDASYEGWLERRERRYRKEARRTARRMQEDGVSESIASDGAAIEALLHLHHARWEGRGGSNVGEEARAMLERAVGQLTPERLWVALLQTPSEAVAAELVVRAGDTAVFWTGGFDPSWARNAPGTQAMLLALRHLAALGVRTADLGGGAHDYKRRLADRNTTIVWRTVFPRGVRYPLIRMRLAPKQLGTTLRGMARRLPAPLRERLKQARSSLQRRSS